MESTPTPRFKSTLYFRRGLLTALSILFLALGGVRQALAVHPLDSKIAIIAGDEGRPGYKDGDFSTSLFNRPLGLSTSDDGTRLFVADSGNNRVRVIHLDQFDQVTTLIGLDKTGRLDGPLTMAQINNPRGVLYIPGERLAVNDYGNMLLRLVDLKAGSVTTLAEGPASKGMMRGIEQMAYLSPADSIVYTQPEFGCVRMVNLKSGQVSTLIEKNALIPNPAALWCQGNRIFVADTNLPKIYELNWKNNAPVSLLAVGNPLNKVLSLSMNDNILYSLLALPGVPAQRYLLDNKYNGEYANQLVTYRNPWGDLIPQDKLFPPRDLSYSPSIGFAPDPSDARRFYVSKPGFNMIYSFRDLFGSDGHSSEGERNSNGLGGPEYPAKKPKGTYRILIVGDSRSAEIQDYPFDSDFHQRGPPINPFYPHNLALCQQTEYELNWQASLDDAPNHFEVFNLSRQGNILSWPVFDVPEAVKKNDIDLVILFDPMADFKPYHYFFTTPLTSDGIPKYPVDPEYLMKPPEERIPNDLTRKFYDFCKAHNLVQTVGNVFRFDDRLLSYPELHDSLLQFYGKSYDVLNRELLDIRTSEGKPVKLIVLFTYTGRAWVQKYDTDLWIEACDKYHISTMNLNYEMNALHLTYYPLTGDDSHLNPSGNVFFSRLLAHDLIRDKLIPWTDDSKK